MPNSQLPEPVENLFNKVQSKQDSKAPLIKQQDFENADLVDAAQAYQ